MRAGGLARRRLRREDPLKKRPLRTRAQCAYVTEPRRVDFLGGGEYLTRPIVFFRDPRSETQEKTSRSSFLGRPQGFLRREGSRFENERSSTRFHSNRGAFLTGRFTARVGDATAHAASVSATHAVRHSHAKQRHGKGCVTTSRAAGKKKVQHVEQRCAFRDGHVRARGPSGTPGLASPARRLCDPSDGV